MSKIAIIGSGFAGISAAAYLSAAGHEVHVFEKNKTPGGRARHITNSDGYVFDMGPSWYWMPGVFTKFFKDFGHTVDEFYDLKLLDPSFDIVFKNKEVMHVPENHEQLANMFEAIEPGSSGKLHQFMKEAQFKYETGMERLVYKPGLSLMEFADIDLIKGAMRLEVFSSFSQHVRKFFKHPKLIALMEFPVLFLGAMPQDTPALYSLMNYAGLKLGTWYPMGGFGSVVKGMIRVAEKQGASFHYNATVEEILVSNDLAKGLKINGEKHDFDAVIGAADYNHVEEKLLPPAYRNYSEAYWEKKTFAPSCLIFYLGVKKRIASLQHHTLFFDEDLEQHAIEIYKQPKWPSKPLFYVCCPSKTDPTVAPEGHENLFLLMPLAVAVEDTEALREKYFQMMINRLNAHTGEDILAHLDYKQSYCVKDFILDYNSYKGNAYGLANILTQTAILKPKMRNKKIKNLYYAGQLTVPGPGVPPSIISGEIAAKEIIKNLK